MPKKIYLSPSDQNRNAYAYGNTNEMEQCRRIADETEIALKRCGFEVINNQTDEMEARVTQSNNWEADMHIPIHTNAFNGQVGGTRVFYWKKNGYGDVAAQAIYEQLKAISPGTSDNISAYPGLYELKHTTATSVYVEVDFHDVPEIAKWIIENPTLIGETICKGVCDYYGVEYIAPKKKLYRVQVGAFAIRENAENLRDELRKGGYEDAFIVEGSV